MMLLLFFEEKISSAGMIGTVHT